MGKIEGCYEIWESHSDNIRNDDFAWYNDQTGRSFKEDLDKYRQNGILPPFWMANDSPFKEFLPQNLLGLIGKTRYCIPKRFQNKDELKYPDSADIFGMMDEIIKSLSPAAQLKNIWNLSFLR